jgi:ankyrin repeat protein
MRAAAGGHVDVVRALLEAGADPTLRDANGRNAADLARQFGYADVLALLEARPKSRLGGLF